MTSTSSTAILETEAAPSNTYFAPLKTWDFFARTLHLLTRKPGTFLTISFLFVGLHASFQWLTNYLVGPTADYYNDNNADDVNVTSEAYDDVFTFDSVADTFMKVANWVLFYLAICLLDGATVRAVAELYVGERLTNVTAALAIGTAAQHLVQLVGACLLVTAAVMVPMFGLIFIVVLLAVGGGGSEAVVVQGWILAVLCTFVLALVVAIWTYHMYPAIIVERKGIVESVQRSIQLTEGHRGEIFTILLLWNAFNYVLTMLVTLIAWSISGTNQYVMGTLSFPVLVFTSSFGSM